MSQTHTTHEPGPDELAHVATDDAPTDGHDDHPDGERLGPVDVRAWGALGLGVAAGLLVAFCLLITTALLGTATPV
jgi:hypothetical protein